MIGWKWNPSIPWSRIALSASAIAASPFRGSTAAQAWAIRSGWRSLIPATYAFVQGGEPVTDSMSNATSTASTPACSKSRTTSSSSLATHGRFQ